MIPARTGVSTTYRLSSKKLGVPIDQDAFETSLEEMSDAAMTAIRELRVHAVQVTHSLRQVAVRRLDREMIVVGHEAVGMTNPVAARHGLGQYIQKRLAVGVVLVDRLAPITPGGDVAQGAGKLDA